MCAFRDRKGFSSFTAKLSRMVGNVKGKRKALAAQNAFLLDLFSARPSSPAFTPLFPFFSSHTAPPSTPSKIPHFTPQTPSTFPLSPSPLRPTAYSTPNTSNTSPVRIHGTPCSAPVSPQRIPHIDPHPEKKKLHTHPSLPLQSNPSPGSASVAFCHCRGEHSVHRTMWMVILLALLCIFLCIGKEIAFVVHLILQIALGLGLLGRRPNVNYTAEASFHPHHEGFDHSGEKDNIVGSNGHTRPLNRSATVPRSCGPSATSIEWNRRSKSWAQLNDSVEGKMQPSKASDSMGTATSERAMISSGRRGNLSAELKLQVMLLFTLGGLFYGRFLAMSMAVCCILTWSQMEKKMETLWLRV